MILTIEKLQNLDPGIFAKGETSGTRWVAVRGWGYFDWCIYTGKESQEWEDIMENGDKVFSMDVIKLLVPCDRDALNLYRW